MINNSIINRATMLAATLAILVLATCLLLTRWRPEPAPAALPNSANGPALAVEEGSVEQPSRKASVVPIAPGVFAGSIIDRAAADGAPVAMNGHVVIARAEEVSVSPDGHQQFRSFVFGGGAPEPCALGGASYEVQQGRWSMPIAEAPLSLVRVELGGRSWRLRGERQIRPGATEGTYFAEAPERCEIVVMTDAASPRAEDVHLLANAIVPDGIPIRIATTEASAAPPTAVPATLRKAPEPPYNAVRLADSSSNSLHFDAVDYERELWVGRKGHQWERLRWLPTDRRREVRLLAQCELRIALTGLEEQPGSYGLRVCKRAGIVASWSDLRRSGLLTVAGIGAGDCQLIVSRSTDGGSVTVTERRTEVLPYIVNEVTLSVTAAARAPGELLVGYCDPLHMLDERSLLTVHAVGEMTSAFHRLGDVRNPTGSDPGGVGYALLRNIPAGDYLVSFDALAEARSVSVASGGQSTVNFDLADLAAILEVHLHRDAAREVDDEKVISWQYVKGDESPAEGTRSAIRQAPAQVVSRQGVFSFRARPGRLAIRLRSTGSASVDDVRVVTVPSGITRLFWEDQGQRHGLVRIRVERVPQTQLGVVVAVAGDAFRDAGACPVHRQWRYVEFDRDSATVEIDCFLPLGTTINPRVAKQAGLEFDLESLGPQTVNGTAVSLLAKWRLR